MRPRLLIPSIVTMATLAAAAPSAPTARAGHGMASDPPLADGAVAVLPAFERGPRLTLLGARAVPGTRRGARLEYPDALGPGVDLVRELRGEAGLEDWVRLPRPPTVARVRYRLELGAIAGLRLVDRTLEGLDAEGTPRVRMSPPWIADAQGRTWPVAVKVLDCAVDTDPSPPWGRAIVRPGAPACTLELGWSLAPSGYPALLDPEWSDAGDMAIGRSLHSATRLADGRVLIVGGYAETLQSDTTAAELFDPRTRTFAATGALTTARRAHVATLLDGGNVAVLGGDVGLGRPAVLAGIERYDPATGRWSTLDPLVTARSHHTVSRLQDGRLLVVGSYDYTRGRASAEVELCSAAATACRTSASLSVARAAHSASPLPDGRILVAGGGAGIFDTPPHATTSIFDPARESWSPGPPLPSGRFDHAAITLADGTTLLIGGSLEPQGKRTSDDVLALAPAAAEFTLLRPLRAPRWLHQATLLPGDRVFVLGDAAPFYTQTAGSTAETYDVLALGSTFTADLEPRFWHTQTLLSDGSVMVVGGGVRQPRRAVLYPPPPLPTPAAPTPTLAPSTGGPPLGATPRGPDAGTVSAPAVGFYSCAMAPTPSLGHRLTPPLTLLAFATAWVRRRRVRLRARP